MRRFLQGVTAVFFLAALGVLGVRGHAWLMTTLDAQLAHLDDYRPPVVARVVDHFGRPIEVLYRERRLWINLAEVPPLLREAVIAAEDRRFYEHPGFDVHGILRAASNNLSAGHYREGGSTLTQQLVKHLVVGNERSLTRKAREALLAWRLEQRFTKDRILELYLNYVYLGAGNYGVEAAARDYFNKSVREVDAGEAALLAGLIPSPSTSSPRVNPTAAATRRDAVLRQMVDAGYLTPEVADAYRTSPVAPPPRVWDEGTIGAAYRTEIRRAIHQLLGPEAPFDHGLEIHTGWDPDIQQVAELALAEATAALEERQGHAGPAFELTADTWEMFFVRAPGMPRNPGTGEVMTPGPGDCFLAGFLHDKDRRIYAGTLELTLSDAAWASPIRAREPEMPPLPLFETARAGQVYRVCVNEEGTLDLEPRSWVQGAVVVLDNGSGEVRALVGGRGMPLEGFNRATQARRQPGSAFKPLVFAAALEAGWTQLDGILDAPVSYGRGAGRWAPRNYAHSYHGRVSLRTALSLSLNTAAVRLGMAVGVRPIIDLAGRLGIRSPLHEDPTLTLGAGEVTPLELATAYAAFARGGRSVEPVFITQLFDRRGAAAGRAGEALPIPGVPADRLPGGPGEQVLSPESAWQMVEMLGETVRSGTARKAARPGYARAAKTGTSSDFADAWLVGFTPEHTVVVWMGCDERVPLGLGEAGGKAALPVWAAVVEALEDRSDTLRDPRAPRPAFTPPPGIVFVSSPWGRVGVPADRRQASRR